MKIFYPTLLVGLLLMTGCAANLKSVRSFADETKKISVAFDPLLTATVEQCKKKVETKMLYAGPSLSDFKPEDIAKAAENTCKAIAQENTTAKNIGVALSDYASKLSAIAGDGIASSVDDDYDALSKKIGEFKDVPKEKVTAVTALFKFITKNLIAKNQKQAIEEALDHEEAVGVLGDALVLYTERVYGAYLTERDRDLKEYSDSLRSANIPAPQLLAKLQLVELHRESIALQEQRKVIPALRTSVAQMKTSLRDLRENLDKLSDKEQRQEVTKLAKEVRALYQQLNKAF